MKHGPRQQRLRVFILQDDAQATKIFNALHSRSRIFFYLKPSLLFVMYSVVMQRYWSEEQHFSLAQPREQVGTHPARSGQSWSAATLRITLTRRISVIEVSGHLNPCDSENGFL
jgi:hypothetical protein